MSGVIIAPMVKNWTNQTWLDSLSSNDERQTEAIEELRKILVRAALYTFQRNLGDLGRFSQMEIEQLAEDCTQEALVALLKRLPDFRGESKFTTWAYKFAINISLTMCRRERWKGLSLDGLEEENGDTSEWLFEGSLPKSDPELEALRGELWEVIRTIIRDELTEKQRLVLKWMVFDEVPMDVVVEHLEANRNAVYKILHDARRKMKRSLEERGLAVGESLDLFQAGE